MEPKNVNVTTPPSGMAPTGSELNKAGPVEPNIAKKDDEVIVPKGKKKIEVDADVLQKILDKVEGLEEQNADLMAAADLGRISRIQEARNKGKLAKSARVSTFDGKIVLGWRTVEQDVFVDHEGKLHETQNIELVLDGGIDAEGKVLPPIRSKVVSLADFGRLVTKVKGDVVKESKDDDGQTYQTVLMPDGRKFELSIVFLN